MIKGIFFDFSGTLDNVYGKHIVETLKHHIELVIITNAINEANNIHNIFNVPVVNPVVATKYITHVINIIDYVPYKISLPMVANVNYSYKSKIDRIIYTGNDFDQVNENFLLPFTKSYPPNVRTQIDTVFKPHETIFHVARLHLSKEYEWHELLMIGDSYHNDIMGAMSLGMKHMLVKKDHHLILEKALKYI